MYFKTGEVKVDKAKRVHLKRDSDIHGKELFRRTKDSIM